mmetsp:Transcript_25139/g.36963  ORF Transcript_25139/g.36963 Transcript_25139/m.36963 type:complete len:164 (+) Transcript_25139:389-880(+)
MLQHSQSLAFKERAICRMPGVYPRPGETRAVEVAHEVFYTYTPERGGTCPCGSCAVRDGVRWLAGIKVAGGGLLRYRAVRDKSSVARCGAGRAHAAHYLQQDMEVRNRGVGAMIQDEIARQDVLCSKHEQRRVAVLGVCLIDQIRRCTGHDSCFVCIYTYKCK